MQHFKKIVLILLVLSGCSKPGVSTNNVLLKDFNNKNYLEIPDISIYVKDGILCELANTETTLFKIK